MVPVCNNTIKNKHILWLLIPYPAHVIIFKFYSIKYTWNNNEFSARLSIILKIVIFADKSGLLEHLNKYVGWLHRYIGHSISLEIPLRKTASISRLFKYVLHWEGCHVTCLQKLWFSWADGLVIETWYILKMKIVTWLYLALSDILAYTLLFKH